MNIYKYSIHCDEAIARHVKVYTYIVASDGERTDMARIYVLRKKMLWAGYHEHYYGTNLRLT